MACVGVINSARIITTQMMTYNVTSSTLARDVIMTSSAGAPATALTGYRDVSASSFELAVENEHRGIKRSAAIFSTTMPVPIHPSRATFISPRSLVTVLAAHMAAEAVY